MRFQQECVLPLSPEQVWLMVVDVPTAARCIPGVEEVTPREDGGYQASMRIRVGPMSFSFQGTVRIVERDEAARHVVLAFDAADRRVGAGAKATVAIDLAPVPEGTRLSLIADVTYLGKLAEFGQPLMQRKAASVLEEFARNLASLTS